MMAYSGQVHCRSRRSPSGRPAPAQSLCMEAKHHAAKPFCPDCPPRRLSNFRSAPIDASSATNYSTALPPSPRHGAFLLTLPPTGFFFGDCGQRLCVYDKERAKGRSDTRTRQAPICHNTRTDYAHLPERCNTFGPILPPSRQSDRAINTATPNNTHTGYHHT